MRLMMTVAFLILVVSVEGVADPSTGRLQQSRAIVGEFAGELQQHLQAAMASGGPVEAIHVCKELAPSIALHLSEKHGARVGRTSLKLRNPSNAPDPWQRAVLRQFEAMKADGLKPQKLEHFEEKENGAARYMKAIPVQALCLGCHGATLAPDVSAALAENYPDDQATGYSTGDIRGAFRIDWPATVAENSE